MKGYDFLKGRKISLVIWNMENERDVRVLGGEITSINGKYSFRNESDNWNVSLQSESLELAREVTPDLKEMLLNADYVIPLSLANLPNDLTEEFRDTGIKWK